MASSADITVLNTLLSTVHDSVNGYRESSRDVDSQQVQQLFQQGVQERTQVAQMLRDAVVRMGGEPTDSASTLGAAHQAFMKLREMVTNREDKAIIEEVERGEDYIKEKFETAIGNTDLSPQTLDVVQQAYMTVKQGHDRVRDLKQSINV